MKMPQHFILQITLALLIVSCTSCALHQQPDRVALLIGNDKYSFSPLNNPLNDVDALDAHLSDLNFDVKPTVKNQTLSSTLSAIKSFYKGIENVESDVLSILYYAGHAMQIDGENYLIPVDVDFQNEEHLKLSSIPLTNLLNTLPKGDNRRHLVIIDACRNNPVENLAEVTTSRGITQVGRSVRKIQAGLKQVLIERDKENPLNILIAYATAPNGTAADGLPGTNGTYTKYLIEHIKVHKTVEDVFKLVRDDVRSATSGAQTPWYNASLPEGDIFFFPPPSEEPTQPPDIIF